MLLKDRITEDMKSAMRSQDKQRLGVIRLILSAIKQYEVDERKPAEDQQVIILLDKMLKQRRESIDQYEKADRKELAEVERFEITIIEEYLPKPFSEAEVDQLIIDAIALTNAKSIQEMGKVMAQLKPQLIGRADMSAVGVKIKQRLSQ